jgi:hypothetical protein
MGQKSILSGEIYRIVNFEKARLLAGLRPQAEGPRFGAPGLRPCPAGTAPDKAGNAARTRPSAAFFHLHAVWENADGKGGPTDREFRQPIAFAIKEKRRLRHLRFRSTSRNLPGSARRLACHDCGGPRLSCKAAAAPLTGSLRPLVTGKWKDPAGAAGGIRCAAQLILTAGPIMPTEAARKKILAKRPRKD